MSPQSTEGNTIDYRCSNCGKTFSLSQEEFEYLSVGNYNPNESIRCECGSYYTQITKIPAPVNILQNPFKRFIKELVTSKKQWAILISVFVVVLIAVGCLIYWFNYMQAVTQLYNQYTEGFNVNAGLLSGFPIKGSKGSMLYHKAEELNYASTLTIDSPELYSALVQLKQDNATYNDQNFTDRYKKILSNCTSYFEISESDLLNILNDHQNGEKNFKQMQTLEYKQGKINEKIAAEKKKQEEVKQQQIQTAVNVIKAGKYEDAATQLAQASINNQYPEYVLYYYATARDDAQKGFSADWVISDLSYISPDYDDVLGGDIKKFAGRYMTKDEWENDYQIMQQVLAKNALPVPSIGMTADQVRNSRWGSPSTINRTTTTFGTFEQWVYSSNRYVYLKDGIVTAIQD